LPGLLLGTSVLHSEETFESFNPVLNGPLYSSSRTNTVQFSAQYSYKRLRIDYEKMRALSWSSVTGAHGFGSGAIVLPYDGRGWYSSIAYRLWPHLEVGTYHSRYYPNADQQPLYQAHFPPQARHLYDQAVTAHFEYKTHFDFNVEGHFMDGYGDPGSSR